MVSELFVCRLSLIANKQEFVKTFCCFNFGNSEIGQKLDGKAEIREKIDGSLEMLPPLRPPKEPQEVWLGAMSFSASKYSQ